MRYISDIQLDQAIVHIVDPGQPNGYILSERALPLAANPSLVEYFIGHVRNSLRDPTASAARFATLSPGGAAQICAGLLAGQQDLVDGSRQLADRLYQIIAKDKRIKGGSLAVCLYHSDDYPTTPAFLALLKIDPGQAYRPRIEKDASGKLLVNFEIESNVMPSAREKLQKCAFIQPLDPRPEYDMILLDRQARPDEALQVARFFKETFLEAEHAFDARQRTKRLYRALLSAQNQLRPELTPAQVDDLSQAIAGAVNSDTISLDEWIEALPLADEQKQQVNEVVVANLPDREFEIDRAYGQELSQKRRFRGDHDLRVEVPAEHYAQIIRSAEQITPPGEPPRWRVVIETEKWEEVTK